MLYKSRIWAGQVGITNAVLQADVVVSESLAVDNSFVGALGMIPGLVDIISPLPEGVVCGFSVNSGL